MNFWIFSSNYRKTRWVVPRCNIADTQKPVLHLESQSKYILQRWRENCHSGIPDTICQTSPCQHISFSWAVLITSLELQVLRKQLQHFRQARSWMSQALAADDIHNHCDDAPLSSVTDYRWVRALLSVSPGFYKWKTSPPQSCNFYHMKQVGQQHFLWNVLESTMNLVWPQIIGVVVWNSGTRPDDQGSVIHLTVSYCCRQTYSAALWSQCWSLCCDANLLCGCHPSANSFFVWCSSARICFTGTNSLCPHSKCLGCFQRLIGPSQQKNDRRLGNNHHGYCYLLRASSFSYQVQTSKNCKSVSFW